MFGIRTKAREGFGTDPGKAKQARRFRRTTLVAVFCTSALIGIALARVSAFDVAWLAVSVLLVVSIVRRQNFAVLLVVILAGICLGGWRGTVYMDKLAQYEQVNNQKVTIIAKATEDGYYGKKKQFQFDVTDAYLADGSGVSLVGKIGVSGFGENMVFRGDTLQITGKVRPGTGSHQAWMSFAEFHAVQRDESFIEKVRHTFGAGMLTALPEPLASFGMGLLIGQHSSLPEEVHEDLLMVGLVHIIAVSGYNLTIILRAGMKLFGKRSKFQTMIFSVGLICVFLLLTGSSASIVRASIVSGLTIAAWYYGRSFKPVTLILLAALVTGIGNPLYIWSDIGWYLSFLAFYGVLVLSPQIRHRLVPKRFHQSALMGIALDSICAEIMTLPLILYIFGQMSIISLVANVVIAVFVPLAMLVTVCAGIAGTFLLPIAGWIAWPAVMVLTYMLDAARILAGIPNVFRENIGFSLVGMIAMYGVVLLFNVTLHSRLRRNRAIITALHEENTLLRNSFSKAAEPH